MTHNAQPSPKTSRGPLAVAAGLTVLAAYLGYQAARAASVNRVAHRPADDAPPSAARTSLLHSLLGTGGSLPAARTITVNRPRDEVFAFWADLSNLPKVMRGVDTVTVQDGVATWHLKGPGGQTADLRTVITDQRAGEHLAWASTEDSAVRASGRVTFRDAPAGRGTEIAAELFYAPPLGEVGRWMATLFQTDPALQGRRDLRRFKMLMEAGEIATNGNPTPN